MNEESAPPAMSESDGAGPKGDGREAGDEPTPEAEDLRRETGLAIAAAGISILGFVSMFRLRVGWDQSRARAFRRFLGVQVESMIAVALGYRSLNRLRNASSDKRGVPFAVVAIVLGVSNLVRAVSWLRQDRPEL
jgi:hypothetical protein